MNLLDLFFTNRCILCGEVLPLNNKNFCPTCINSIYAAEISNYKRDPIEKIIHCYSYDGAVAHLLKTLKHQKVKIIRDYFADKITETIEPDPDFLRCNIITCIPRFGKKHTYCQSEYIAKKVAANINVPFYPHLLVKKRNNKSQTKCRSIQERQINVEDLFRIDKTMSINEKTILIIDDIMTTGATLLAAAETIKTAWASKIFAATAAYTPMKRKDSIYVYKNPDTMALNKTSEARLYMPKGKTKNDFT